MSDPILSNYTLQSPVFLLNSRYLLFRATYLNKNLPKHSFSRSYRVNLPSSFNIVISHTLVYSTYSPVSVLVRSAQIYYSILSFNQYISYTHANISFFLKFLIYYLQSNKLLYISKFVAYIWLLNFNRFPIKI